MSMIQWLNEALERKYFTEDYEADRKKYTELVGADKRLTPEEFDLCCSADPTYKEGSNKSGSYLTWIIKRYTDFRKNNPSGKFDFTSCADDLKSFNEIVTHKLFLKGDDEKHDINYFTSLQELDDFVKSKNTHRKESVRQQQKSQNATTVKVDHVDPDLVFENDRCKVWVPYTYETSRKLGGDTNWCTAASTRENWDNYSNEGPLFIMIMKDDPDEKYQFFFENIPPCWPQFMDRNNDPVDLSRFPEMQMPWVDEVRKEYCGVRDQIFVSQLDALLNRDDTLTKEDIEKADELINSLHDKQLPNKYRVLIDEAITSQLDPLFNSDGTIQENNIKMAGQLAHTLHDEQLARKYGEPINKVCLELFYSHLTPVLTKDSQSIQYLKYCVGKVDIALPSSVTSLGDDCFKDCESLKSITIPSSVKSIGESCFWGCKSLESITIPSSVTRLERCCFCHCTSLASATIPSSVTRLGNTCFGHCTSLKSITIPSSVTRLGGYCFWACHSLESINISDSAMCIDSWCFDDCPSFTDVYYRGTKEDRAKIEIDRYNARILRATWHYNYKG